MIVVDEEKIKEWFNRYMQWSEYDDSPDEGYVEFTLQTDCVESVYDHFMDFVKTNCK